MERQTHATIELPPAQTEDGQPLMQVLNARQSSREFGPQPLSRQMLSNLLWAATGVNRPHTGKRTAPSARDWREIEVYAVMAEGAFLYQAEKHSLERVTTADVRQLTGMQDFIATAPLNLVYVAAIDRMIDADLELQTLYSGTDTGFIAQNVYLFCASENLATVVRGSINRQALGAALRLDERHRIVLAQTVGYPAHSRLDPRD